MSVAYTDAREEDRALSGCFGKQTFDSPGDAARAARRISSSLNRQKPVGHYRCRHCGDWHIGGRK
jgi:hypothetical protein